MRRVIAFGLAAVLCLGLAGCRTDAAKSKAFITRDNKVVLEPMPTERGETIFRVENNSPAKRQVVLLLLDEKQNPAKLPIERDIVPTGEPSEIEHRGSGYRVVEKLDDMRAYYGGDQRSVTTMHTYLRNGSYVLMSNLPGDYSKGLWVHFRVGASS